MSINIKSYPVEIEGFVADTKDLVFKVRAFDEAAAEVTISTLVDVATWDVIAPKIREALVALELGGENADRPE